MLQKGRLGIFKRFVTRALFFPSIASVPTCYGNKIRTGVVEIQKLKENAANGDITRFTPFNLEATKIDPCKYRSE